MVLAFLIIIGFVVYPAIILLRDYFKMKEDENKKQTKKQKTKHEEL